MLNELEGKTFRVRSLIDYQENAVVSKTLVDRKAGTITLFAFDEGQSLSEHTAPFHALAQILEGEAEIRIGDETIELSEGENTIIPEDEPHSLEAKKRFKMLLTMIKRE
ncbi:cupin [candidate division MSBL1 archaeon SCGC-AAA259E17]|uniref:Cupin n=1 Tax=candidate division MSBL1 archaeon SCGC-AAA259E17 TaxID=1698263 RepID=A0A133UDW0_9EURY|nr:cupin [candidate division MSBL1 archaeon SCGC-AAA259E17]